MSSVNPENVIFTIPDPRSVGVLTNAISLNNLFLNGLTNDPALTTALVIDLTDGSVHYKALAAAISTLGPIGATPNANGATITGSILNLEPASGAFGGVVTTGTQTFAGNKTFTGNVITSGDNSTTGDVTTTNGNVNLPTTTSATSGVITFGGNRLFHAFSLVPANANLFIGENSGNFVGGGGNNVCIGTNTGLSLTSGGSNVIVGNDSGDSITTGSGNILLGRNIATGLTTGSDNIVIGEGNALGSAATGVTVIGTSSTTECFMQGIFGATVLGSGIPVFVDVNGQLGTVVSSIRYKKNVNSISNSNSIHDLRPVTFNYIRPQLRADGTEVTHYGLIAEEVATVLPELVVYKDEQIETVRYDQLVPLLLAEIQQLRKEVNELLMAARK